MADPITIIGLVASIVQLCEVSKKLIGFGRSVYTADEVHVDDIAKLEMISAQFSALIRRVEEAERDPKAEYHKHILAKLDWRVNPASPVKRALNITATLQENMVAWQKERFKQLVLSHWKKEEIAKRFADLLECWHLIHFILFEGHYELSKSQHRLQKDHLGLSEKQLFLQRRQDDRLSHIEDHLLSEKEERLRKEVAKLRWEIIDWLSPLEFQQTQEKVYDHVYPTGRSFLDSKEFLSWQKGKPWVLRCHGDTGAGKTSLASIAINHLQQTYSKRNRPIICVYIDSQQTDKQTPENLYGSLLKQLMQLDPFKRIPQEVQDYYVEVAKDRAVKPKLSKLKAWFKAELENYDRVYLVADAVNESSMGARQIFDDDLPALYENNLSVMVTTTDKPQQRRMVVCDLCGSIDLKAYWHCSVCPGSHGGEGFDMCEDCHEQGRTCQDASHERKEPQTVEVEIEATEGDLTAYVNWRIREENPEKAKKSNAGTFFDNRTYSPDFNKSRLARKLMKTPGLLESIPAAVVRNAKGKFLLAKLYVDDIADARTTSEIKKLLNSSPDTWQEFYEQRMKEKILDQRKKKDRELALKVLSILTCARRALTLLELQHALAITPGERERDPDDDYEWREISEVTQGLLTIDDGEDDDSYVRFFHMTLHTYLYETREKWFQDLKFANAEAGMAMTCLTCLGYDAFSEKLDDVSKLEQQAQMDAKLKANPFAAYALQFWGEHVKEAESDSEVENLAMELLRDEERIAACVQAAWLSSGQTLDVRKGLDALHLCAWFGLHHFTLAFLLDGHDVNVREQTYGQTPLMYACQRGHIDAVQELLNRGADVNMTSEYRKGDYGCTSALLEAIKSHDPRALQDSTESSRAGTLELLLSRPGLDINYRNPEYYDRTPLMTAIRMGKYDIVPILLQRHDIDVNISDRDGYTALSLAANNGADVAVKHLLSRPDINVNCVDTGGGRTPLMFAAQYAPVKVKETIQALLGAGADPNIYDIEWGGTALSRAIERAEKQPVLALQAIETLLTSEKIDLGCVDDFGNGLLHNASEVGRPNILRLLGTRHLDINLKDNEGSTPLHKAISLRKENAPEVVKLLLELGADPNITDMHGNTPSTYAELNEDTKVLDAFGQSNATRHDSMGANFPICTLVKFGRIDDIKAAIAASTIDLSEKDIVGNSALHVAVLEKQDDILRFLLEAGIDTETLGEKDTTALQLAARDGRIDAFNTLLEHDANVDATDYFNHTPLSRAEQGKHWPIAIKLIEAGATINPSINSVQRLFFEAVRLDSIKAVKILLDMRDDRPDPLAKNEDGLNARQLAKKTGDAEMIRLTDSAKSFATTVGYMSSEQSSFSSIHSMPSPPTGFLPFRRRTADLRQEQEELREEPEEMEEDESLYARLAAL